MEITDQNYYTSRANWQRLSVSQYKKFEECEAAALAQLKDEWEPDMNWTALRVGNFVHSYFESEEAHAKFKEENKDEMFSSRKPHGLLKAFQIAEQMIERAEADDLFNYLWQGEREVIVKAELFGVEWKAKIDLLNVEKGYFVDLKTTGTLDGRFWSTKYGRYVSFVEQYGYTIQIAVYEKLLEKVYGKPFTGYLYAVTKQTPSDIAAIAIEEHKKEFELELVEANVERIVKVKNGEVKPKACGKCDYCRQTKKLNDFIMADDLLG